MTRLTPQTTRFPLRQALIPLLMIGMMLGPLDALPAASAMSNAEAAERIRQAGGSESEAERYRILAELLADPTLSQELRSELERLLPLIDLWANGKRHVVEDHSRAAENGYLCRFIDSRVKPEGQGTLYPAAVSAESPLYPIWCLYRGRMLIWRVIQSGPLLRVAETRNAYYGEGCRLLEQARVAYPENQVIGMYLGEPIPWPKAYPPVDGLPKWANLQREGLEKLADLIHWWIDERQLPDGQFGGGWGDDVEMWRWWAPLIMGFDDPKIAAAQALLSNGIFQQPHMQSGFTARMTDVEHANEDTTDTITPMMHLAPDDPLWTGRARRLAELMAEVWTGTNAHGFRQFKSIYFNASEVADRPDRAFDTVYHPSAVQPALLLWQRTDDPWLDRLFGDWLRLWVDAAARSGNGKPAGVLPSAVRWPDGALGLPDRPWWEPFPAGHNDALYNWPGATRLMTSALLLAYHKLGDEAYLQPMQSMVRIRLDSLRQADGNSSPKPGTEAWAARRMGGFLSDAVGKYRFLTGDNRYDDFLEKDASGYARFRLFHDEAALLRALERNAAAFRSNWEAYTAEMRWTDRVLNFTGNYLRYFPNAPESPNVGVLYAAATGDPGNPTEFPLNRVRWRTPPRAIAALVTEGDPHRFEAKLVHFGEQPRQMGAELFLLKPGRYRFVLLEEAGGAVLSESQLVVEGPSAEVSFDLPPKRVCLLRCVRMDAQPRDD